MDPTPGAPDAIRARRGVRRVLPHAVPFETREAISDAARRAPSGLSKRPWWLLIVRSAEKRETGTCWPGEGPPSDGRS